MEEFGAHDRRERARRRVRRQRRIVLVAFAAGIVLVAGVAAAARLSSGSGATHHAAAGGGSSQLTTDTGTTAPELPPEKPHGTVTIAAVGDTMLGTTPTLPPSPGTYLARMRPALHGDVVFGNLEGTLTDATASKCGGAPSASCFAFRVPPEFASALHAAGFTIMSNANNHSFDSARPARTRRCTRSIGPGSPRPGSPARSPSCT